MTLESPEFNCPSHPEREVVANCFYCGKGICEECQVEYQGKGVCSVCLDEKTGKAVFLGRKALTSRRLKMIAVKCKKCGIGMRVDEKFIGKTAKCPKCKAPFVVPEESEIITQSAPSPERKLPFLWIGGGVPALLAVSAIPIVCAVVSTGIFYAQGGFGGGHGKYDIAFFYLGLPAILLIEGLPFPDFMGDLVVIIWIPAIINALLFGAIAFFVSKAMALYREKA